MSLENKERTLSDFHMEEKLDFTKSKMTFNPEYEIRNNNFVFRKPLFIACSVFACLLLVGTSVGITAGVINNYDHGEGYNIINQSYGKAKDVLGDNISVPTYVFVLSDLNILNCYEFNNNRYIQLYSLIDAEIKASFSNNTYSKNITLKKQENIIEQLNTADFTINDGDVVNADVYINDVFNRKITLNF